MICSEVMQHLEKLSPVQFAESWDNVGLLVGRKGQEIHKIMVSLDASRAVVEEAKRQKVDMLVTHHPMIFKPVNRVTEDTVTGERILTLTENHIAYYAMHTNFDIKGGMAELAAKKLSLLQCEVLEPTTETQNNGECVTEGIGRVGMLEEPMTLQECGAWIKEVFQLPMVMLYGDGNKPVHRVAISPGSGKSLIESAHKGNADVLITGDIGHHEGLDASDMGLGIIDATHYGLEHIFIEFITAYLQEYVMSIGENVEIIPYDPGSPVICLV